MTLILHQATPVTSITEQAHILYHWLTVCCQFTLVDSVGTWTNPLWTSGSNGYTTVTADPETATKFYSPSFAGTESGYISIRDPNNPENTTIGLISSVFAGSYASLWDGIGLPENNNVRFPTTAANLTYAVFDPTAGPVAGNYFVIQNLASGKPGWQAQCTIGAASIEWVFSPLGGWDAVTHAWSGSAVVSNTYFMRTSADDMFGVASPDQGWFCSWLEDSSATIVGSGTTLTVGVLPAITLTDAAVFGGGDIGKHLHIVGSTTPTNDGTFVIQDCPAADTLAYYNNYGSTEAFLGLWTVTSRTIVWMGSLRPLHAPGTAGFVQDTAYAAIFGTISSADVANITQSLNDVGSFAIGESLSADLSAMVPTLFLVKRLLSTLDVTGSNTAVCSNLYPEANTRSGSSDDYEINVVTLEHAIRGVVQGLRFVNNRLANRTLLSSNNIYVLENGIGIQWIPSRTVV